MPEETLRSDRPELDRPSLERPSLERRARARKELTRRVAEGGIRYFAAQEQQAPVLQSQQRGCLVLGGNRAGKTVIGAAETVYRLLGEHPHKQVHKPPILVWAASQDIPGVSDQPHKQLEELRRWIPKDALRGGRWETAYSAAARVLTLANGSRVVFKGYSQELLKFESEAIHFAWFDEEPEEKRVWTSTLLRLADYSGQWMMTLTPVLSLLGKGWVEELWEGRSEPGRGYEVHQLFTRQNPNLPVEALDELFGNLSEEERLVRESGAFARLGGRVLSEFDPSRHLVPDHLPGPGQRVWLIVDPGWRTSAHLWAYADTRGAITLFAEHYAHEEPIPVRMAVLHGLWQAFGQPDVDVIVDSAGFSKTRQGGSEKELPSDVDEYREAAEGLGAGWFAPRPCRKADPLAYRVKRYLATGMLRVCRGMRWWQWEQERWTRQRERGGALAGERPEPEAPIKRYDHLMDATRYLINELPDPLSPERQAPPPGSQEAHWERVRGELDGTAAPEHFV